jgi:general secretion pathway protein A
MYQQYYGLSSLPFQKGVRGEGIYAGKGFSEALARLQFVVKTSQAGLLLGETGSGKTTVIRALLDELDPNKARLCYLNNPTLKSRGIFRDLCVFLGERPSYRMAETWATLREYFQKKQHPGVILIIDEIHLASYETLEALRLFFDFEGLGDPKAGSVSPFSLILLGHTDFSVKLKISSYQSLNQRIAIRYHLSPLDLEETLAYIKHHMKTAGSRRPVFEDDALEMIFETTGGIPRKINLICQSALLLGASEEKTVIGKSIIKRVVADLRAAMIG